MPRIVDPKFDLVTSQHHLYNLDLSQPYVKNKVVLDIGCWAGLLEKQIVGITKRIVGIDPEIRAIQVAKKQVPKAEFKVASVLKLPFLSQTFDTALMFEVIEHIPLNTEIQALNEINKVLKNKGMLLLSTPHNHPLSIILDPAFFLIAHRHYSIEKIGKLLTNSGFKIKKIFYTGGILFLLKSNLELIWKHLFKKGFDLPNWYLRLLYKEYKNNGFATIHVIAQKISLPKKFL